MAFYQSIAPYYDRIFPFDAGQIDFIRASFPGNLANKSILDIGCGTGSLALELAQRFQSQVIGIDLDGEMLQLAEEKAADSQNELVQFQRMNMLEIGVSFAPGSFELICCFGNTLVHLQNALEIGSFLSQCKMLLAKTGKLLLQIINYDHILAHQVTALPLIEDDVLKFERLYHYFADQHRIHFDTILTIKAADMRIENRVVLYPLVQDELQKLLTAAGFQEIRFYGNFKREVLTERSLPVVVEAR